MITHSFVFHVAGAMLLVVALPLAAQTPPAGAATGGAAARQGERVRVYRIEDPAPLTGAFDHATPQGLMILVPGADRTTQLQYVVPYDSIVRLTVSRGLHNRARNTWRGAGIGLLGGALIGAVHGNIKQKVGAEGPQDSPPMSTYLLRWSAGGAALGAIVGYMRRSVSWVDVPLPER